MMHLGLGLGLGVAISFVLTPLVIRLARRYGFVDDPKTHKHPAIVHTGIIPRAGGLPIFCSVVLTYLFFTHQLSKQIIGIFLGGLILVIVGLIDDRKDISPYVRFFINFLIAILVVGFGVGIGFVTNPLGGILHLNQWVISFEAFGGTHNIIVLADIVAVLWIVWMMNAINWSSGVDGQLPGIVVVGAVILGLVALPFAVNDKSQLPVVYLATATAAAYLGFLPWSFYPQKIMPGYGGAALGGYLLAILSIFSVAKVGTALIILAVPMIDGGFAIIRRLLRKQSPFRGDKEHFHHHLLALGWSKRSIALFYWMSCAILGLIALALDSRGKLFALLLLVTIFSGISFFFWRQKREGLRLL